MIKIKNGLLVGSVTMQGQEKLVGDKTKLPANKDN